MKNEKLVEEWLRFSKNDSDTVDYLYNNMRPLPLEIICYHSQQAVEKLLKGLLTAKNISFDKKHDLTYLYDLLDSGNSTITKEFECCARLTPYGVAVRYPGGTQITEAETKQAISDMKVVSLWVKKEFVNMKEQEKHEEIEEQEPKKASPSPKSKADDDGRGQ